MTNDVAGFAKRINRTAQTNDREITPYRATITAVVDNLVQFMAEDSDAADVRSFAQLDTWDLIVDDVVWVVGRSNPVVVSRFLTDPAPDRTITGNVTIDGNLTVTGGGGQLSSVVTLGPFLTNDIAATAVVDMNLVFCTAVGVFEYSAEAVYLPAAGEVIGLIVSADANRSSGSCTIGIKIDGSAQAFDGGATCVLNASNTRRHGIMMATGDGEDFAAGNRILLTATTSGWGPTTANLVAWVIVRFDY